MYYYYDESGISGLSYNGTKYSYVKNLQGDVIGIINENGATVVSYTYDAWGNVLSVTGSMAATLGAANPFRYRGYYYDTETGFYYLNSRYYDPTVGRFLNADGIIGANGGIMGYNMFAYCNNNPVMYYDSTGYGQMEIKAPPQCPEEVLAEIEKYPWLNYTDYYYSGCAREGEYMVYTFQDLTLVSKRRFWFFGETITTYSGEIIKYYFKMTDNEKLYKNYMNRYNMLQDFNVLLDIGNGGGPWVDYSPTPYLAIVCFIASVTQTYFTPPLGDYLLQQAMYYKDKPNEYELVYLERKFYQASVEWKRITEYV